MLISEFARATGLTQDTIRFYVRRGLLAPQTGSRGGRNPYQVFSQAEVSTARLIQLAQGLGFSLREIAALNDEFREGSLTPGRQAAILRGQLARLEEKAGQLAAMVAYLRAKLAWLEDGSRGPEPALETADGAVLCAAEGRAAFAQARTERRRRGRGQAGA